MKKLITLFCFCVLLFYAFYRHGIVIGKSVGSNPTIKQDIYHRIASRLSIPYEDAKVMFQWGYKKLKREPISRAELMQAKKAFFRTGVPIGVFLAIISRYVYIKIKEKKKPPRKEEEALPSDQPPLTDIPVPDSCADCDVCVGQSR